MTDSIYTRLHKAQQAVKAVEKDGNNTFHRYRYATAENMIEEARAAMHSAGLSFMLTGASLNPCDYTVETVNGKGQTSTFNVRMTVCSTFSLMCADGHLEVSTEWPVIPEPGRPFDKALAAARTASLSYVLRDILLMPRAEEGTGLDSDDRDPGVSAPVRPLPPRPAPVKPSSARRTREQVEAIEAAFAVLGIPVTEWSKVAKKEANGLDPGTVDGAAAVLEGLDRMITAARGA